MRRSGCQGGSKRGRKRGRRTDESAARDLIGRTRHIRGKRVEQLATICLCRMKAKLTAHLPHRLSRHSSTSWPPTHRGCPRGRRRCPTPKWCMNAARRRPRGRAHCHGRALCADHNPQLLIHLKVLSTACGCVGCRNGKEIRSGSCHLCAGAQRDCTLQSEGSHPPAVQA